MTLSLRTGEWRGLATVAGVLLFGLALSGLAARNSWQSEKRSLQADFDAAADNRVSALRREIDARVATVNAVARAMARARKDEQERILSAAAEMQPGLTFLRWIEVVKRTDRAAFERSLELDKEVGHGIREISGTRRVPAASRPVYYPVTVVAPATPDSREDIGLDAGAWTESLEALRKAERTGELAATAGMPLIQRGTSELGILIFAPVFHPGSRVLRGFVESVVYPSDLLEYALKTLRPGGVHIEFRDQAQRSLLYRHVSRKGAATRPEIRPFESSITFADRTWKVRCEASSAGPGVSGSPLMVLVAGIIISVLIALLINGLITRAARVEQLVEARTNALAVAAKRLEAEIEDHHATERALAAARDEAVASSRLKSQFLANVSHEIRTPVNGILGTIAILRDSCGSCRNSETLLMLQRCAHALATLIDDLLDMARIEAGRLEICSQAFLIEEVVAEALSAVEYGAGQKGLVTRSRIDVPIARAVTGDPGRIRQVLLNFLANAVKFTDAGEISVSVTVCSPDVYRFEVRDSGIGISETDQALLFRRFVQVDGTDSRRRGGTGLGLAISKQLIELMGGQIGVSSAPGEGSTFWFQIRLPAATGRRTSRLNPALPKVEGTGSRRILLAEDNEINRKVALWQLKKLGYEADAAENGTEVLEALERQRYSAILMDCQMPVMDGFEATRRVREHVAEVRDVPIIALTANAMEGERDRCLGAGMDDYLAKPLEIARLAEVLERWTREDARTPSEGGERVGSRG